MRLADRSIEPGLRFTLKIDSRQLTISEGETLHIDGTFVNPEVTLSPLPNRLFDSAGATFEYPRGFGYEADFSNELSKSWTLSGNDFKIMYFQLKERVNAEQMAASYVEELGEDKCVITDRQTRLMAGGNELEGVRLRYELAGHTMSMDVYVIPWEGQGSRLLVFQDSVAESGGPSHEATRTLELLKSTFALKT